jgi:zinc finger HIT domain-containing protein 1
MNQIDDLMDKTNFVEVWSLKISQINRIQGETQTKKSRKYPNRNKNKFTKRAMSSHSKKLMAPLQQSRTTTTTSQPVRQQYRVIDEVTRNRRNRQLLDQLERDNFHEDPHANLVMHKKAPKFEDGTIRSSTNNSNATSSSSSNTRRSHIHRTRILTLPQMIEEDSKTEGPNYSTAVSPPPSNVIDSRTGKTLIQIPQRHFCSVCGFQAPYTCVTCGHRYCSVPCLVSHRETRCLKWTVWRFSLINDHGIII